MLATPNSKTFEIALDIFQVAYRPCRAPQEKIYDYHMDGRPQFEWERFRQMFILEQNPKIWTYCENCPLNIFGQVEGCRGKIENLDIFFRALNELVPDSPWCKVSRDGAPVNAAEVRELAIHLEYLQSKLGEVTWPVAMPRQDGHPYHEVEDESESPVCYYAWNGEGPPGLIFSNDGYMIFLSRHGLLVKATYEDPVPHAFRKLWKEGRGVFGLTANGETVGFTMSMARYPTWGFESLPGCELSLETLPANQVFMEVLDVLEVFCGVAQEYETGILISSL